MTELPFHLLRPHWFWILIPLLVLLWRLYYHTSAHNIWRRLFDEHLIQHLVVNGGFGSKTWLAALAGAWLIAVLALAGPSWSKLELPVFKTSLATVIVLDLSKSMHSGDLKPSRLARAKFKALDVLKRKRAERAALIIFANDAFVVAPITDDANTIAALIPVLDANMMPSQGSRLDRALTQVLTLRKESPMTPMQVLVIADDANPESVTVAASLWQQGVKVSVLGVGTPNGAPIADHKGGFVKDHTGSIVLPKLFEPILRQVAKAGGGDYQRIRADDTDIERLLDDNTTADGTTETKLVADQWRDEGVWLTLLLLPLASLAFRKGWLMIVLLALGMQPQPAMALSWADLWWRDDQQAAQLLEDGEAHAAAQKFDDVSWRGAANYRAHQYDVAAQSFAKDDSAQGHYNRANALAKLGQLREALDAYDSALSIEPTYEDAIYNRAIIEKFLRETLQQPGNEQGQRPQGESAARQSDGDEFDDNASGGDQNNQEGDNEQQGTGTDDARREEELDEYGQTQANQANNSDSGERGQTDSDNRREEELETHTSTDSDENLGQQEALAMSQLSDEDVQALEQWLRQIPDDPGGLLRRKLLLEHRRRQVFGEFEEVAQPW